MGDYNNGGNNLTPIMKGIRRKFSDKTSTGVKD